MARRLFGACGSLLALAIAALSAAPARAQVAPPGPPPSDEARIVADAATVLEEMLQAPGVAIPRAMLSGAEGIAIVPRVIKGGFIVGARHGRGLVIAKDANGAWHAPIFLTLTGGNVGWQAGVQATDVVLVYRSQRSVESLMQGKLTIGADVAAAAGPVGRQAAAATDTGLTAEVYSYSRSRGLFAGVSLDGSVLKIDNAATAAYYSPAAPGGAPVVPVEAQQLTARVVGLAQGGVTVPPPDATTDTRATVGPRHTLDEAAAVRDQLSDAAPRLFRLLDPAWQQHLSLPAEVFREAGHVAPDELAATVARYDAVARDPRYAALAARPEFQSVHALLRQYQQAITNERPTLALPPPPG